MMLSFTEGTEGTLQWKGLPGMSGLGWEAGDLRAKTSHRASPKYGHKTPSPCDLAAPSGNNISKALLTEKLELPHRLNVLKASCLCLCLYSGRRAPPGLYTCGPEGHVPSRSCFYNPLTFHHCHPSHPCHPGHWEELLPSGAWTLTAHPRLLPACTAEDGLFAQQLQTSSSQLKSASFSALRG